MANLLSNTTIGGYQSIHTGNIGSYALTSVPANVITTSNIGSQSVNFANSSTSAAYLNYTAVGATQLNANTFSYGRASNYYGTVQILNSPENAYASLYNFGGDNFSTLSLQLFASVNHNDTSSTRNLWFRVGNNLGFQNDWKQIIHSGSIGSQSVSYATTAGALSSMNISQFTNNSGYLTSLPSHNHDDRYYTESESDGRFQPLENQRLSTGNSPTFNNIYADGWFRNYNSYGLYNEAHGNHFYATSSDQWNIAANGSYPQIIFRSGGYQSTVRGYVYADTSNQIGFLNNAGDWSLKTNSSKDTQIFGTLTVGSSGSSDIYMTDTDETTRRIHTNSGRIGFLNSSNNWGAYCDNTGNWFSDHSMRAPIFYDSQDTSYYLDPNGSSVLNGTVVIKGNDNQLAIDGTTGALASGLFFRESGNNKYELYHYSGEFRFYNYTTGQQEMSINNASGYVTARTSFRAPIFYDSNDTNYYVDPNSNSYLSTLRVADATSGVSLHVGLGSTHGVYTADNDRKYLVVSGTYYPHMALVATSSNNSNHGPVFSFVGSESGAARQWNMGIANSNPFVFSIGYNRTGDNNPHYGIGDGWHGDDNHHARLSIDRDGNTKIRGMLYINGTSGAISTGSAVIHAGNIGSQSVSYATTAGSLSSMNISQFTNNSGYITGYTETDTLASVTGRGASTSTNVSFNGTLTSAGQTILAGAFRFYTGGSDGSTAYGDFRTNPATGNSIISAKSNALYFNYDHGTGGVIFCNGAAGIVGTVDASGNANFIGAITQNGNQVLHAGNYNSYSPTLTGGGANGTWGINITGDAGSVAWTNVSSRPTALSQFSNDLGNYGGWLTTGGKAADSELIDGIDSSRIVYGDGARASTNSGSMNDPNQKSGFHFSYNPTGRPYEEWWNWVTIAGNSWQSSNNYQFQLAHDFHNDGFYVRRMTAGTAYSWREVITSGNIGSQSVSYASTAGSSTSATNAGQLNTYGYLVAENWNEYYTSGKLRVASVAGSTSTGAPPSSVHNFGSLVSYGISGEDMFQMYFPDNAGNSIANSRKLHYRTGRTAWCDWRTVVDMVGDTLTIVEGGTPKIVVRGSVPYGQPTSASIELVGDADGGQTQSYRWISTAPDWGGQEFRLERKVNNSFQLVGRVPKNTFNLEWQGTIVQGLSDSRVKTNIVSMTEGLDKIDRIRPVTFDWVPTEDVSDREGADFGFIAQELEEVLPEVVHTRGDGYKTVMYEKVVPVLVQAMKEQQAMIDALKAEIELLKNK